MAKTDDFREGFNLVIDRLLHLGLIHPDFNANQLVRTDLDAAGNPRALVPPEKDLGMDIVATEEFWPFVEPKPEPEEDEIAPPPARTPLVEHYPSWIPRLLGAIDIHPRGSRKSFTRLNNKLKNFSRSVAQEKGHELPVDQEGGRNVEQGEDAQEKDEKSESASNGSESSESGGEE